MSTEIKGSSDSEIGDVEEVASKICPLCNESFSYAFNFSLTIHFAVRGTIVEIDSFDKRCFDQINLPLCSKKCLTDYIEKHCEQETAVVEYLDLPVSWCDECGHGTHPTEFCEKYGEASEDQIKFHKDHMHGQGNIVPLEGKVVEVFMGGPFYLKTKHCTFESELVQMKDNLEERVPLVVCWHNWDDVKSLMEDIGIKDSQHTETKEILTDYEVVFMGIKWTEPPRRYIVLQKITKIKGYEKVFFPYNLAFANCWMPIGVPKLMFEERAFFPTQTLKRNNGVQGLRSFQDVLQKEEEIEHKNDEQEELAYFEEFKKAVETISDRKNKQPVDTKLVTPMDIEQDENNILTNELKLVTDESDFNLEELSLEEKRFLYNKGWFQHQSSETEEKSDDLKRKVVDSQIVDI